MSDVKKKPKCIVLFSGGLDSSLAAHLLKINGFDVLAVHFVNGFSVSNKQNALFPEKESQSFDNIKKLASKLQIELKIVDISENFFEIVQNPKYGYGANANPCVDCKILMLRKAKELMEETNSDFVATGEILGQRPMSQRLDTLNIIERDSGLKGKLLRPLCAKVLKETELEKSKLVDREKLLGISGRGRKIQMKMAEEIGIVDLVSSTSGCCLLTDPRYGERFKDKIKYCKEKLRTEDFTLLMAGRHFRISENLKLIVGRNLQENEFLEKFSKGRMKFEPVDVKGPVAISDESIPNDEEVEICSSIVARYSDGKSIDEVQIEVTMQNSEKKVVKVKPILDNEIVKFRV